MLLFIHLYFFILLYSFTVINTSINLCVRKNTIHIQCMYFVCSNSITFVVCSYVSPGFHILPYKCPYTCIGPGVTRDGERGGHLRMSLCLCARDGGGGVVVWCGVVWWCGAVWCGGVVRCGGVVGCGGVVWCGVVWCGVVWCGVVWCGVVW